MPQERIPSGGLTALAIERARLALRNGDPDAALNWLQPLAAGDRPNDLEAGIRFAAARVAAATAEWTRCEREIEAALRLDRAPFYQQRLERVRLRAGLLDADRWRLLRQVVDRAERLPPDRLRPVVSSVWACGAYHSRGRGRGLPWSRLLREAKNPPRDKGERAALSNIACGFLCRYIVSDTSLLRNLDIVVAVPPDQGRYAERGMSLPDNMADAVQSQLALVWPMEALVKTKSIELRGLSPSERRQAVQGSFAVRDRASVEGRSVLVVDDVMTSGATLVEAAGVLRAAGATDVHSVVLCHTEG